MAHYVCESRWWFRGILLLLVLAGFALRLHEISLQDIWWDEARNIDVALRPFWHIPTAPELDIHPPVYFWVLHLWSRVLGVTDITSIHGVAMAAPTGLPFVTRSLSSFAGVIAVALVMRLVRQWPTASSMSVIIAGFLAVLSPFWLAESQETRMYALGFVLLSGAALALLAEVGTTKSNQSGLSLSHRYNLVCFVLLSSLALLVHYNAVFIIASWYVWWTGWGLLQMDRWQRMKQICVAGAATTLLILPIVPIALRQIPGYRNPNLTVPSIGEYLLTNWTTFMGGYALTPDLITVGRVHLGTHWLWVTALLAIVGLAVQIWIWIRSYLRNSSIEAERLSFLTFHLTWLLGGLALYYVAVIDRGAFNPRYSSFVTPALFTLIAIGITSWPVKRMPISIIGIAIVLWGFYPAIQADLYDERFAREEMQRASSWLHEEVRSGDVVFVDQKYPFGFYYQRFAIDPDKTPTGPEAAQARYLFVDINTIDQRLNEWARDAERVFWVQWFESDTDPRRAVPFLLDKAGDWSGRQQFRGYTIDWWTLNPPNRFSLTADLSPATHIFPPAVETTAVSLPHLPVQRGEAAFIVIRWKRVTDGRTDRPLKARVALYTADSSSRKGQDDRPILNDRHLMPAEWSRADEPLNVYAIPVSEDIDVGEYEIRLLVYDAETLEPLTLVDLAGNPAGIEAHLGSIKVN